MKADEVFIALGGTTAQMDHDYPVLAAQMAKENGATSVFVATAVGANIHSRISYVKVKGEIERDIMALDFEHTHIFRPAMIMGNRRGFHLVETVMMVVWRILTPFFIRKMSRYKGMEAGDIAKAMILAAERLLTSPRVSASHSGGLWFAKLCTVIFNKIQIST